MKEIVKEDRKTKHNDNSLNKNIEQVIKSENHPKFQGLKRNDPEIENQTPSPAPAKTAVEEVKREIKEEKKNEETKPLKKQQLPPITLSFYLLLKFILLHYMKNNLNIS